jgi:isochorismate hydrolase
MQESCSITSFHIPASAGMTVIRTTHNIIIIMKEKYFAENNIDTLSKEKFAEILKYSKHSDWLPDLKHTALLVLDMQNYFLDKNSHAYIPSADAIKKNVQILCETFKRNSLPIIFSSHVNKNDSDGLFEKWWFKNNESNSDNSSIINELKSYPDEIIVKDSYDAFYNTNLYKILIENKIKDLIVTGVMTHLCCESTIRSAFVRDFRTFFLFDATADYNMDFHLSSFTNLSHGFTVPLLTHHILKLFND